VTRRRRRGARTLHEPCNFPVRNLQIFGSLCAKTFRANVCRVTEHHSDVTDAQAIRCSGRRLRCRRRPNRRRLAGAACAAFAAADFLPRATGSAAAPANGRPSVVRPTRALLLHAGFPLYQSSAQLLRKSVRGAGASPPLRMRDITAPAGLLSDGMSTINSPARIAAAHRQQARDEIVGGGPHRIDRVVRMRRQTTGTERAVMRGCAWGSGAAQRHLGSTRGEMSKHTSSVTRRLREAARMEIADALPGDRPQTSRTTADFAAGLK
jgi:hypothetical protein